ncbi:MAG: hypothetical protein IJ620_06925 [Bacteroidales bacterium]|nr:hypothetical protein [Bacteroidales bacterium]
MKRLLFPLVALLFLATSCVKDPDVIQNYYVGSYVYVEYPTVPASEWKSEIEIISSTVHRTSRIVYEYMNDAINDNMVEDSFVTAYVLQNDCDVALPCMFFYTDGNGLEHQALLSYEASYGMVRFYIESLDGTYDALLTWLDGQPDLAFKVCMVVDE